MEYISNNSKEFYTLTEDNKKKYRNPHPVNLDEMPHSACFSSGSSLFTKKKHLHFSNIRDNYVI